MSFSPGVRKALFEVFEDQAVLYANRPYTYQRPSTEKNWHRRFSALELSAWYL